MPKSEQTDQILPAYLAAQSKMTFAVKGSVNPHFRSKYADLSAVIDAVKGPLNENGICYRFDKVYEENGEFLDTYLEHAKSGQWISFRHRMNPKPNANEQAEGSALSYAKRYGLAAICGIAQDDDDGEAAVNRDNKQVQKVQNSAPKVSVPPDVQEMLKMAANNGMNALQETFNKIPVEIRQAISGEALNHLKKLAAEVDKSKTHVEA